MLERVPLLVLALAVATARVQPEADAIYDEKANATTQIRAALRQASRQHKNVVLVFGANWCGDCHALDQQMHRPALASLIGKNYVVVKIDVGRFDKSLELGKQYQVPIEEQGIPALVVLDPHGKLLHAQEQGEFANARQMDAAAFQAFFEQWKPKG